MSKWTTKVITSIPEAFPGILGQSVIGNALKKGIWSLETINLRDFAYDKRGSIDDTPYGGGPGMIIRPDVVEKAIKKATENMEKDLPMVYMTPVGEPLKQKKLKYFSCSKGIIILCGRYEGVDERVFDAYDFHKISIGDFVVSGGEVGAMTLIEGCVRLLPGVLGKKESLNEESFNDNLLEYPQYTRPSTWEDMNNKKRSVPEVLISGDHKKIQDWRKKKSLVNTKSNRPDLKNNKD